MILKIISYRIRLLIPIVLFFVFGMSPLELKAEPSLYIAPHTFLWREFAEGSRQVKESGLLVGAGIVYPIDMEDNWSFIPRAELFGGSVDYEGHACDLFTGICVTANTTVNYFGFKLDGDLAYRRERSKYFLEPFGGLGFRIWSRDIQSGTTSTGETASAYEELWTIVYGRAGARIGTYLKDKNELYLQGGAIIPFYVQNTAYTDPDITMTPGNQVSYFAEAGLQGRRLMAALFYDSLRFPQSPIETEGFVSAYQPQSTMDVYGLRVGLIF